MRILILALAAGALAASAMAGDERPPGPAPKPPGIHWEPDLEAGLMRAALEGRPVLFAVNALETERANNSLAGRAYRSAAWGAATRGYVAFVCNPNDHAPGSGACTRYPGHTCTAHKAALDWFLARFGVDLISPQHVIFEPDGDVAYRKEYYTGVVGPVLLEGYLSNLAPRVAYVRAGIEREARMDDLETAPTEEVEGRLKAWLADADGLAAAAILNVYDDCYAEPRRLAIIRGLRHTPALQAPVLGMAAEDAVLGPTDAPAETRAWLRTLFAVDRRLAVWGAASALVRLEDAGARDAVLRIWAGRAEDEPAPDVGDLPATERAAAYEALILAGDRRAGATPPDASWTAGREAEIRRARRLAGIATPRASDLAAAIADGTPRRLRPALIEAEAEDVVVESDAVREIASGTGPFRVRIAAALALLRADAAGAAAGRVRDVLLRALADPIEGRDTRRLAIPILGTDPGQGLPQWRDAIDARLKESAR